MRVLIIGPFRGKAYDECQSEIQEATDDIKRIFEDATVCCIPICEELLYLSYICKELWKSHAAYFIPGWEADPECCLIRTEGTMMTVAVKNYLKEKNILDSMDVETLLKGAFVTVPIGFVSSLKIAFDLGIMEVRYYGKAKILQ